MAVVERPSRPWGEPSESEQAWRKISSSQRLVNAGRASSHVAIQALAKELDALHASYPKPMIFTEFVAETLPGSHGTPPEMSSAEYQAETIRRYLDLAAQRSYMAGTRCGALPISKRRRASSAQTA